MFKHSTTCRIVLGNALHLQIRRNTENASLTVVVSSSNSFQVQWLKQKSNLLPPSFVHKIIKADIFKHGVKAGEELKADWKQPTV
tara:strand:- start:6733 stop:6987 length:255 start_codon:yes stop_codon:yes gene_type:complete